MRQHTKGALALILALSALILGGCQSAASLTFDPYTGRITGTVTLPPAQKGGGK